MRASSAGCRDERTPKPHGRKTTEVDFPLTSSPWESVSLLRRDATRCRQPLHRAEKAIKEKWRSLKALALPHRAQWQEWVTDPSLTAKEVGPLGENGGIEWALTGLLHPKAPARNFLKTAFVRVCPFRHVSIVVGFSPFSASNSYTKKNTQVTRKYTLMGSTVI